MTEGNDAFERNLERLIRGAAPPRPDADRARREFLARAEGESPSQVRWGWRIAMAASILAVVTLLYAVFAPKPAVPPQEKSKVPDSAQAVPDDRPAPDPAPPKPARPEAAPGPARQPLMAKDGPTTLSFTLPPARTPEARLAFAGTTSLPDQTALSTSVTCLRETLVKGKLVPKGEPRTGLTEVSGKAFSIAAAWEGPGRYVATLHLREQDQQYERVKVALKKVTWNSAVFEFDGWGDELAGQLAPSLADLDILVRESIDVLAKLEKLASQESSWVKERRKINERSDEVTLTREAEEALKETDRLLDRLRRSQAKALLPAACGEMESILGLLHGNARNFNYEKGKFAGAKSYHGQVKTLRGDALDFETAKKYLDEVSALGGRETALWLVKDLKRTGATPRPAFAEALKLCGSHAGIATVSDRLAKAALTDLDAIEETVRAGK